MRRTWSFVALAAACLLPATAASGAVVSLDGNTLIYRAAPGETNAVQLTVLNTPDQLAKTWFDYQAPLTAGAGCLGLGPVTCPPENSTVYLGDRDDVAYV